MSTLVWTDKDGKIVKEIPIPKDGMTPDELIDAIQNYRTGSKAKSKPKTRKAKKIVYKILKQVSSDRNNRRIVFTFQDSNCYLNLPDMKMYHESTGDVFLKSHYDDISISIQDVLSISVTDPEVSITMFGFTDYVMSRDDLPWYVSFFTMLKHLETYRNDITVRLGLLIKKAHFDIGATADYSDYLPMLYSIEKIAKYGICLDYNTMVGNLNYHGSTIHEVLRVPSWITEWIKDHPLTLRACMGVFQELSSEDYAHANMAARYLFEQYNMIFSNRLLVAVVEQLIQEYEYPHQMLIDYTVSSLVNQGLVSTEYTDEIAILDADPALRILRDYVSMCKDIGARYERYPRFLTSVHNIAQRNYRIKLTEIMNEKYYARIQEPDVRRMEWYPNNQRYFVSLPASLDDIVAEGKAQVHCVASYIEAVVDGSTNILFMRDKESPDESLITLEVSNDHKIVQAKRKNNRHPGEEEEAFLHLYATHMRGDTEDKDIQQATLQAM